VEWKRICALFLFIVYLYYLSVRDPVVKRKGLGIPLISVTPPHVCACPKLGLEFPTLYGVLFVCSVNSVKMRGDCSFC